MPKVSDEEMEDRKEQLRDLLCATKAEIDELVRSNPSVLERRDIVKSHGPKVAMLQERLGINEKAACRMCLSSNRLLCASLENLESTMNWLQERLNLSEPQLRTIIGRAPGILTRSIEDNLQPSLEIIQSCLNLSDKEVTKLIVRQPGLLLSFLENLLNTEEDDLATLRKAIMGNPLVLFWSEETMLGIQQWMKNRLGLGDAKIAQMCRNSPQILTMKVATLEEKVDWAQAAMSLSDEELCELFGQFPSLFGYDPVQKLQPKLRYLRKRLNLDDQGLKDLVTKQPGLFSRTEKHIEEKIKFYSELVGESEAKRLVTKSSNLLVGAVSLEKRLKPRLSEVQNDGKNVVWTEKLIQRLARRTDDLWEKYGLREARRGRHAT